MKNLTPMQAAYWTGRQASGSLGNVSAHLYVEFDCGEIDPQRLGRAVRKLYEKHEMTRLKITPDGYQIIGKTEESFDFEFEDLSGYETVAAEQHLRQKRRLWTCRQLDLASGQTSAFGLTLRPGATARLHVDTDMIAIDPPSLCLLMEDLARFYESPDLKVEGAHFTYFDWLDRKSADETLSSRQVIDRQWWTDRLADVPDAPTLPSNNSRPDVRSGRLAAMLSPDERASLDRTARGLRITLSTLTLGLFAAAVGKATGDRQFRLNVPMFWRAPYTDNVDQLVGDFTNTLIVSVDLRSAETLSDLCSQLSIQLIDLLTHSSHPGVNVLRDLSRSRKSLQNAPIVFTAGLDLPTPNLFSETVTRVFGPMSFAVSEGPQVALDAQVAAVDGGILVNWDINYDVLPVNWIEATFKDFVTLLKQVASDPSVLDTVIGSQDRTSSQITGKRTEDMLCELLTRLAQNRNVTALTPIGSLGIEGGGLAEIIAFFNRYLPSLDLTVVDVETCSNARQLGHLIKERSRGESEKIAQAYLAAIAEITPATSPVQAAE